MKEIFTTGQVAKICRVAPRTVSKWFDSGRLKGYRIPGSQDRRIPCEELIKFLRANNMQLILRELVGRDGNVLCVGLDITLVEHLRQQLPADNGYQIKTVVNEATAAVIQASHQPPGCVVVEFKPGHHDGLLTVVNLIRRQPDCQDTVFIALRSPEDSALNSGVLREAGFAESFSRPYDIASVTRRIQQAAPGLPVRPS